MSLYYEIFSRYGTESAPFTYHHAHMKNPSKAVAYSFLAVLIALYIVGAVSHGSLRHEVQTLALWFPIVFGFQKRELAKWSALPCLIFWLTLMVFIWLFLLGWARIVSGTFSPIEIAMTLRSALPRF